MCKYILLPKQMIPSMDVYESIGFVFHPFENDNFWRSEIPPGWKVQNNPYRESYLLDEKERKRGEVIIIEKFGKYLGFMELFQRYSIRFQFVSINANESNVVVYVNDRIGDKCIAEFGEYRSNDWQFFKNTEAAELFLNINLPFWHDPLAYWD